MDAGVVRRYMARLAEHGSQQALSTDRRRAAALGEIGALDEGKAVRHHHSRRYIQRLEAAQDARAEGVRICLEVMRELSDIPQVAGCHIMAPGNDAAVPACWSKPAASYPGSPSEAPRARLKRASLRAKSRYNARQPRGSEPLKSGGRHAPASALPLDKIEN